jgi:tetratricopeptide (TPR) repeat protein
MLPAGRTRLPYADAVTSFARALGAARGGQPDAATADLEALASIRALLAGADLTAWAEEVAVAEISARVWQLYATGDRQRAIAQLREAADRQDRSDKSAISPGPLAPSRELLAEMLLDAGRPAEAQHEFEAVLKGESGRFRSLAGAAAAAARAGDHEAALAHSAALVQMCTAVDTPGRPALEAARRAVIGGS